MEEEAECLQVLGFLQRAVSANVCMLIYDAFNDVKMEVEAIGMRLFAMVSEFLIESMKKAIDGEKFDRAFCVTMNFYLTK